MWGRNGSKMRGEETKTKTTKTGTGSGAASELHDKTPDRTEVPETKPGRQWAKPATDW
jgi:hypothetical protein